MTSGGRFLASKRLTRKEIVHKDPIQVALETTSSWLVNYRIQLIIGLVLICAGILAVYGWNSYSASRHNKMQSAFAEGLELYHGTVKPEESTTPATPEGEAAENEPAAPEVTYDFASQNERLEKSLESFLQTAEEYSGSKISDLASYYAALCYINLSENAKAEPILQELIAESDYADVRNLARNSSSQLASANKDISQAIALLEQIIEDPSDNYPVQFTLMNLALLQEANGELDKALSTYQRVATEYGETTSAAEARTKISSLDPKGEKAASISEAAPAEDPPAAE